MTNFGCGVVLSCCFIASCGYEPDPEPQLEESELTSELSAAEIGYYCSTVFAGGAWTLFSGPGDNPCSNSEGGVVRHVGLFSTGGTNVVQVNCIGWAGAFRNVGFSALQDAFEAAAASRAPSCEFRVTMSSQFARQDPASPIPGCADGVAWPQDLGSVTDSNGSVHVLVGCPGTATFANRAVQCATAYGWTPAPAAIWANATVAPQHDYWTDTVISYSSGTSNSCRVQTTIGGATGVCAAQSGPMRVCTSSGNDSEGNTCSPLVGCRLDGAGGATFGGCSVNRAGTICERVVPRSTTLTPPPWHALDVARFRSGVHTKLDAANLVGYQFATYDPSGNNNYSSARGKAFASVDMTIDRRLELESLSKLLTATALVAIIEDLQARNFDIDYDTSIVKYLPSNWSMPFATRNLTFRHLLNHVSGFANCSDDYGSLGTMLAHGPEVPVGTYRYSNCNYSMMRILIAYLVDGPNAYRQFEGNPDLNAKITALSYRAYVRGRILAPLGLSAVDEFPTGVGATPRFHADHTPCWGGGYPAYDEMILQGGPKFWFMSAGEYGKFVSSLARGQIISPAGFDTMRARANDYDYAFAMAGWTGPIGKYFYHGGDGGTDSNGRCGDRAEFVLFSDNYVGVFVTNTADPGPTGQNVLSPGYLWDSFNDALLLQPR